MLAQLANCIYILLAIHVGGESRIGRVELRRVCATVLNGLPDVVGIAGGLNGECFARLVANGIGAEEIAVGKVNEGLVCGLELRLQAVFVIVCYVAQHPVWMVHVCLLQFAKRTRNSEWVVGYAQQEFVGAVGRVVFIAVQKKKDAELL